MQDQNKALSPMTQARLNPSMGGFSLIPVSEEYEQNYIVHRVNLPSIEITEKTRDVIEATMAQAKRFVRVGQHTIMINSISGIDPMPRKHNPLPYGSDFPNVPELSEEQRLENQVVISKMREKLSNKLKF